MSRWFKRNWWIVLGIIIAGAVVFYILGVQGGGSGHGQLGPITTTK